METSNTIKLAALVADMLVIECGLPKYTAMLLFDALAEGLRGSGATTQELVSAIRDCERAILHE